jgi:hypothetical protein
MQKLYRINVTACHKPWRDNSQYFTTNKLLFEYLRASDYGGGMISEVTIPEGLMADCSILQEDKDSYGLEEDEEPDMLTYLQLTDKNIVVEYPYILLGEVTFYTE